MDAAGGGRSRRRRLSLGRAEAPISVVCWEDGEASAKPPALLVHGTGFVAEVWNEVADSLTSRYVVYALDRRGHGRSHKPEGDRYHFLDFARDLRQVVEELGLDDVVGVGHSAGATDLLLVARWLPSRISGVFAIEPTFMDARSRRPADATLSEERRQLLAWAARRRAEFDSRDAARQRLRSAPAFAAWSEASLDQYLDHGFEPLEGGRVRLRCLPEIETAMLLPIFEVMEEIYAGDERGHPFAELAGLRCPVRVATTERSAPIYKEMAQRTLDCVPTASPWHFTGTGHCVAQETPGPLVEALEVFVQEACSEHGRGSVGR